MTSIIVEFENATLKGMEELRGFLQCLEREISRVGASASGGNIEILCVHPGREVVESSPAIQAALENIERDFVGLADVEVIEARGARYYELKNAAARRARGEIIVFVDSDILVTEAWLKTLLAPFADREVVVSCGLTSFLAEDFISRTFALTWFFPLANDDPQRLNNRAPHANNIAFRRAWFVENPYPLNDGFKVSCTLHTREITRQGVKVVRTGAVGYHRFWEDGVPFLLWRAAVMGRDADRKFLARKGHDRFPRSIHALSNWGRRMVSVPVRIVKHRRKVGMPAYEVPFAILVSWAFDSIASISQFITAIGLQKPCVEYLPSRFQVH
jgi:glycosyltransferase involved in cell wall biosynthesis